MPNCTTIDEVADELRRAIEAGNFEAASGLVDRYGRALQERLSAAGTSEERVSIAGEALTFLSARLQLARAMRSHIASRLASTSRLSSYRTPDHIGRTWQLEG
jgi:hypothetical protein